MLVTEYNNFVLETDQYTNKQPKERQEIALYGLVGEIGSLLSAIKKQYLSEDGVADWNTPNDEIVEELGDVIWYCFSLNQIVHPKLFRNIFKDSLRQIKAALDEDSVRGEMFRNSLDTTKKSEFLEAAKNFPKTKQMRFADYQQLAFMTARTRGRELLEVCLAVLWQLGAELLRRTLPDSERRINKAVRDRTESRILGEIAWHVSAIASLFSLKLEDIVSENVNKASFRKSSGPSTELFDCDAPPEQQFPRKFEVSFVSLASDRARMYWNGRRLGDDLTDNSYRKDGYRFHDVMHLSNAAILGWSPVLRDLMKRKRKYNSDKDEKDDGGRARIVEELVIKAIHSEGRRLANLSGEKEVTKLFTNKGQITFRLVKQLREFVDNLEVEVCQAWEWKEAAYQGAKIFYSLTKERQGTVFVDLDAREVSFRPEVCIGLTGLVCRQGMAAVNVAEAVNAQMFASEDEVKAFSATLGSKLATNQAVKAAKSA